MESKMVVFCAVVAVLGIASAAAGFAGEATRVKASDVYIEDNLCVYPSSPAFALGIMAAMFAILSQIYIIVTFGGCNCCQSDYYSTPTSVLLYVLSWVASVAAVVLLLAAAALNNKQGGEVDSYGYITCYIVQPGIFAAGAVLALLSAVFGIAACVRLSAPQQKTTSSAIGSPVGNDVDLEKSPMSYRSHECSP